VASLPPLETLDPFILFYFIFRFTLLSASSCSVKLATPSTEEKRVVLQKAAFDVNGIR
jgi:hypothetical protein